MLKGACDRKVNERGNNAFCLDAGGHWVER